jgi:hypothetical protein
VGGGRGCVGNGKKLTSGCSGGGCVGNEGLCGCNAHGAGGSGNGVGGGGDLDGWPSDTSALSCTVVCKYIRIVKGKLYNIITMPLSHLKMHPYDII